MDFTPLPSELEELILCSCCHLPFNETDALPKLFSCRHYFCLKCVNQVLLKGNELYCVHCWKRTELTGPDMKPDALPTHNAILYLSQNLSMISSGSSSSVTAANKKPPDKPNGGGGGGGGGGGEGSSTTSSGTSNGGGGGTAIVVAGGLPSPTSSTAAAAVPATPPGNGAGPSGIGVIVAGAGNAGGNTSSSSSSVGSGISAVAVTAGSSGAANGSVMTGVVGVPPPANGSAAGVIGSGAGGLVSGIGLGVGSVGTVVSAIGSGKYRSKGENCLTHAMPNALWCLKCSAALCRGCASGDEHRQHPVKTQAEARDHIRTDIASDLLLMQKSLAELQHFVFKQRDFLLKILEACTALKTQVETELINHLPTFEVAEIRSNLTKAKLYLGMLDQQSPAEAYKLYANLHIEKQRLQSKYQEMLLQCKLDDLIQHYGVLFDFDLIKQALSNLNAIDPLSFGNGGAMGGSPSAAINGHHNSILLLANYCISQLYSRHVLTTKHHPSQQQQQQQHQQQQQQQQQHQQQQLSSQLGGGPLEGVTLGGGHHYVHQQSPSHVSMNHLHHHVAQQLHHHQQQQQQHHQQHQLAGSATYASQLHDMASAILIAPPQDRMAPGSGRTAGDGAGGSSSARTSGSGSGYLSEILNGSTSALQHQHAAVALQQQQQHQHSSQLASPGGLMSSSSCSSVVSLVPAAPASSGSSSIVVGAGKGGGGAGQSPSSAAAAAAAAAAVAATLLCNPSVHVYPIYFFSVEINGQPFGRILIEVRNDVAPKMAKNFGALCTGELGFGYKGCSIFQCWENESIITGDFELNNGRGGRSVFEEGFFMPDDTKILAIRGSVGMRRSQKRHDNMGLVGSQFRIILREMRGFTGIFAFVVEGLDLVEKISQAGDSAGKPQSTVLIANCGKWQ
ncbi:hormone receptor 4 isoform X2 [Anopheles merus]|nr:hormone receptor 4 isoform X2 [Anopheles merus]XP_041764222.1 hormone receptor 4 isoform X2 [Anopheles merus]XP_041764223.1 hormone receptor 4 isoform X2 [Anopheles merus]XP_041764224.1 hormone receptor 4 isoform X2 [Anopheles merus]